MNSLGKNAFYNVLYKGLNVIFPLVTMAYVSRVLLPVGVGKVASAQNIVAYFLLISSLGLPTYGVKVIAGFRDDRDKSSKSFSELFCINLISTIVCSLIYVLMVFNVGFFHNKIAISMVVGIQLFANIINIDWFYQGFEKYRYITIRSFIVKILGLIATFIFVKEESDYIIYALITALSLVSNFILNVVNLRSYVRISFHNLDLKHHLRPVFVLLASTIAIEIYVLGGTTMLSVLKGDSDVAFYTYSTKAVGVVRMFMVAICAVFLPRLNYFLGHNQFDKFYELASKGIRIIFNICLPTAVGLFLLARNCVTILFGQDYLYVVTSLQILCVTIVTISLSNFMGYQVLVSLGKEKIVLISTVIGAIINVILNFALIYPFGYIGAAIATAITECVIMFFQYGYVKRLINFDVSGKEIFEILIPSFFMIISIIIVLSCHLPIFIETVLSVVFAVLTFVCISYKLKNKVVLMALNKLNIKV